MQAFGSDRVRVGDDGTIVLHSRLDKRWVPRVEKTLVHSEFPGTAVEWEERHYEVVSAEALPQGGVRYVLAPWKDEHAMRQLDRYDEATEAQRLAEYRAAIARERKRKGTNALALFTGHFPAIVQEHLGSELGVTPVRLTLISLLGPLALDTLVLFAFVQSRIDQTRSPIPGWLWLFCGYMSVDTAIRFLIAFSQGRPCGSAVGTLGYIVYYALAPWRARLVSPFASAKGQGLLLTDAPPDVALRDAFTLREPLATLLTPDEQTRLAARFDYDYRHHSALVAGVILVFALIGIGTSFSTLRVHASLSALLSLLVAATLAVEQVVRLPRFARGPAGSILAVVVRPLMGKLLA